MKTNIIKQLALLISLMGLGISLSSPAHACRPGFNADIRKPPSALYKIMPHIFLGQIADRSKNGGQLIYKIKRIKSYKGKQPAIMNFKSATHSCGFAAKPGTLAIFYLRSVNKSLSAITPIKRVFSKASADQFAAKHFK